MIDSPPTSNERLSNKRAATQENDDLDSPKRHKTNANEFETDASIGLTGDNQQPSSVYVYSADGKAKELDDSETPVKQTNTLDSKESSLKDDSIIEMPNSLSSFSEIESITAAFPRKLMNLLDEGVASDAMWWLEQGDGFCIVPKVFTVKVLDQYFQGTKFESFARKLSRWGFTKRATGHQVSKCAVVSYHHSMFLRGKPELLIELHGAKKHKGTEEHKGDKPGQLPLMDQQQMLEQGKTVPPDTNKESMPHGLEVLSNPALQLPDQSLTYQFLSQGMSLPNQQEHYLQQFQLIAKRQSERLSVQQLQSSGGSSLIQAQLLAARNNELYKLLLSGNFDQHSHSQDAFSPRIGLLNGSPSLDGPPSFPPNLQVDLGTHYQQQQLQQPMQQHLQQQYAQDLQQPHPDHLLQHEPDVSIWQPLLEQFQRQHGHDGRN